MPGSNNRTYLLGGFLLATVLNLAVTLFGQGQDSPRRDSERREEIKRKFPVVDYEAPESSDPEKKAKRLKRSQRHDNSRLGVLAGLSARPDSGKEHVLITDWEVRIPRLPAAQSDLVLVGQVLDANAYLSADKNGVYSEFTVRVEDTLKNVVGALASPGSLVTTERLGGRVRYPSGREEWFRVDVQGMPEVNGRYVFFLKQAAPDSFHIITGYGLRDGRAYALDYATQFEFYDGTSEAAFLRLVHEAVAGQ